MAKLKFRAISVLKLAVESGCITCSHLDMKSSLVCWHGNPLVVLVVYSLFIIGNCSSRQYDGPPLIMKAVIAMGASGGKGCCKE